MNIVLTVVLPVFLVMGLGYACARRALITDEGLRSMNALTFSVLIPAMLFSGLYQIDVAHLDFRAMGVYYLVTLLVLVGIALVVMRWQSRRYAVVCGLAGAYGNAVAFGIPLTRLAYGQDGLNVLLMIVAGHGALILTVATVWVETETTDGSVAPWWVSALRALKQTLVHPVIVPIFLGVFWAFVGWGLPASLDTTLKLIGQAGAPLALLLLGASLAKYGVREYLQPALLFVGVKNLIHPALTFVATRYIFDLAPLTVAVLTTTAAMPMGVNSYLFAQRYAVAQGPITAAIALSTVASIGSVSAVLWWAQLHR